ncbi:tetratricopeptide repeat protein [Actinophytocola sp. KF-1]
MSPARHHWIRLPEPVAPELLDDVVAGFAPEDTRLVAPVSAHRGLRGPYTAAGTVMRAVVPRAWQARPEVVDRHQIELLSVAPELGTLVAATRQTLTSLAVPKERTRFYSRMRTQRLSHGLTEFLERDLRAAGTRGATLVVHAAQAADTTDAEFLAIALRRLDPGLLSLVVVSVGDDVPDPLGPALRAYASRADVASPAEEPGSGQDDLALATRYVESDGTLDLPHVVAAYHRLPDDVRAGLHDRRAAELEARAEATLALGAIPYHREHGSDPAGAGGDALLHAVDHCVDMGYYHATIELAARGRAVVDWHARVDHWWAYTTKTTVSLAALGRAEEAAALYAETIAFTDNPKVHMQAAYATGMIYTRHHEPAKRDHLRAKGLLNQAIALAKLLFDGGERAFRVVFNRNGLALVEAHLGNLPEALRLVSEGLELLDAELELHEHRLHRSVLVHNKASVLVGLGRLDEAVAAYDAVIAVDPNYPDYYLDRGNALHRLGRDDEALADYETAIRLGPPFPEAEYNRAEILQERGEVDEALAALDYVLVLEPDMVDAHVNKAGLLLDEGRLAEAEAAALAGLALDAENAYLRTVLGQVHAEHDRHDEARAELDRALAAAPDLVSALVARASVAYEVGDTAAALADLDRAVDLSPEDPAIRYNRAHALRSVDRDADALTDLTAAADLAPDDEDIAEALRDLRPAGAPVG